MTVAALRALIDSELPDVVRPPAPRIRPRTPKEGPVNAEEAVAVSMYKDGEDLDTITAATGLTQDEIGAAVTATGTPFVVGRGMAPSGAPVQSLIAWGMQHPSSKLQRLADQARTALADLQQAQRREAVVTAAEEQVQKLRQALSDAEANLRKAKGAPVQSGRPDRAEAAQIRAWAAAAGHTVAPVGLVPRAVVDAYRAAHAAHAAA